ncbi:hypothetical protein FE257_007016 [Aspergillus nanangensis]|uniref:superoxide dismutase n=1 Tax=Aspergillus nanangensis TaxID=2582783 RepID=A0AAD4CNF0_ASPNN|nr:hypothetical protein FE257_007016 [Aspergillus nanangensis]
MLFKSYLLTLGLCLSATAQTPAPVTDNNIPSVIYQATLLDKDNTTVRGQVTTYGTADKVGVKVHVEFSGVPDGEALSYHIHAKPVPEDGNCYLTAKHLDPYNRTDTPPCDIKHPETCEVGDMSGKHSPVWAPCGQKFKASYTDYFISNVPGDDAFFGDLSVVVHAADGSRLNCGNFVESRSEFGEGVDALLDHFGH